MLVHHEMLRCTAKAFNEMIVHVRDAESVFLLWDSDSDPRTYCVT